MSASGFDRAQASAGYSQLRRLLIRPGAIGDCIVSLPALEFLKTDYTEVWVAGQNVPLIRFADCVRSILSTGIDAWPPRVDALEGFDEIHSWYGTRRPEFRDAVSSFPFQFYEALPVDKPAVDFYLRQVGAPLGATPRVVCPRRDDGFVAIHPFSGSARKSWPHFAELASRLDGDVRFCIGAEQSWPGAVHYSDLYELACWLATARLYIGNDSGITHLAAAVGTPTIAIFQASDPRVWAPPGAIVLERPSVDDIVDAVNGK